MRLHCDHCPKTFKGEPGLAWHLQHAHPGAPLPDRYPPFDHREDSVFAAFDAWGQSAANSVDMDEIMDLQVDRLPGRSRRAGKTPRRGPSGGAWSPIGRRFGGTSTPSLACWCRVLARDRDSTPRTKGATTGPGGDTAILPRRPSPGMVVPCRWSSSRCTAPAARMSASSRRSSPYP